MANSFKSTRNFFGGEYKQKLYFVPCADNEPIVGIEISEPAIFRFLLNEEAMEKFDEAAEDEIVKMLDVLKDIDKQSKITQVEAYQSSMMKVTDRVKAFHVFIVFKSTSETADDAGVYWWSLEKNTEYIVLQRSRNKENVKDKLEGKERTRVKLIKEDLKGKGTVKDLFEILWAQQLIAEKYHIKKSNCQSLVSFVGQQITNIGYKYKGKFKYYPPPEKGRDKKMLELINVITGCSDWSPLFHLIKMGSTDLVDKTVGSGKYDIDASYNGSTPLHLAIKLEKTKMVKHLLQPPMNADPTKRDASGKSALLFAASRFEIKAEIIDLLLKHDKVNVDDVDEVGQTALHLAAHDVNILKKLLERGANPNIFNKWGQSPLHEAAQKSYYDYDNEIIDLLIAHGKVMIDHADINGATALNLAARVSNVGAVQKLLENGANPNIFDKQGRSPLYNAVQRTERRDGNKTNDLLLAHEKVNVDDEYEIKQMVLALTFSLTNIVEILFEKSYPNIFDLLLAHPKVKVDDVNRKGQTALHIAAYEYDVMAVKYFINKGANPNAVDKWGCSPLHWAAQERDGIPIIDLLLEAQKVKGLGDVNDRNKQGRTALHYAAAYSNEIVAEHLINKGANVNCRADVGLTPLDMAALGARDMKIIDLLLEKINEGDIQQYRNDERLFLFARHNVHGLGNTILDRLVEKGIQPPCTKTDDCITAESDEATASVITHRFVDKGADPSTDLTGFDGLDFLIVRVKKSLEFNEILKEEEFDINGRNQNGETPLLVAIFGNNVNAVKLLLERGADPTIRNEDGYTLIHVAVDNHIDCEILNLILKSGKVDINETTHRGRTALYMAVMESNIVAAEFLLSKVANPNVTDEDGWTPLHEAVFLAKDMDIVELLVNHQDVDVNLMDNKGRNALDCVTFNNHGHGERISNLLKEKGAVETENKLPKGNKESLGKLLNDTSSNAEDEIERVLSDATLPIEDKIARIKKEHLISAIKDSDVESISLLLKNGADISSARLNKDYLVLPPIELEERLRAFLKNTAYTKTWEGMRDMGMNALHVASYFAKMTDLIDVIWETAKFDINGVDNNGWTPLHWAIKGFNHEITARHLIRKGADPTIANKEGDTPLHLAASYAKEIETINPILENKQVDINISGDNGMTALHPVIEASSEITVVCYLLKKGADPNAADKNGATPLHLAAETNYFHYETTELIDIILETGKCNINAVDNDGRTPLHYAIERYAPVTIKARRLIEMGANPGIADKNGVTPLHMAAEYERTMDLIDELLLKVKTGAVDVNCVDNQGRTPLACAQDNKHGLGQRIIDRLKENGAKE